MAMIGNGMMARGIPNPHDGRSQTREARMTRFRPREIEIPSDGSDPFAACKLGRKPAAEMLTRLIESSETGLTIGLNAAWGDGKTTFLKMWRQHLVNEGYPTLLFSAWEHDFSDDALVALIGELETGIDDFGLEGEQETRAKAAFAEVKRVGVLLLKHAIPIGLRLLTGGVLRLDEDLEGSLGSLAETVAKERLEAYEASRNHFRDFKEKLGLFADRVAEDKLIAAREARPERAAAIQRRPLVVFIDELDRCRPTFAIEVLEKIKHLFDVEGVVFVLAVDREQLGKSIQAVYGQIDVEGYLRRFFDLDFQLPKKDITQLIDRLCEEFSIVDTLSCKMPEFNEHEIRAIRSTFPAIQNGFCLSIRDCERVFSVLILFMAWSKENVAPLVIVLFLIVLKIKERDVFSMLMDNDVNQTLLYDTISKLPGWSSVKSVGNGWQIDHFVRTINIGKAGYAAMLEGYEKGAKAFPGSAHHKTLIDTMKRVDSGSSSRVLRKVLDQIDLAAKLTAPF